MTSVSITVFPLMFRVSRWRPIITIPFQQIRDTPLVSGDTAIHNKARGQLHQQWISSFWSARILKNITTATGIGWDIGIRQREGTSSTDRGNWYEKWKVMAFSAPSEQREESHDHWSFPVHGLEQGGGSHSLWHHSHNITWCEEPEFDLLHLVLTFSWIIWGHQRLKKEESLFTF